MELIVVVIIIGVLAAVAIPSYQIQMLKMKNQEAVRILMVIWEAQKEYYRENGNYLNALSLNAINAGLDIMIPTPKNFDYIRTFNGASVAACPGITVLADIGALGPGYGFFVLEDGRIVCESSDGCGGSFCKKMGFPDSW